MVGFGERSDDPSAYRKRGQHRKTRKHQAGSHLFEAKIRAIEQIEHKGQDADIVIAAPATFSVH